MSRHNAAQDRVPAVGPRLERAAGTCPGIVNGSTYWLAPLGAADNMYWLP